VNANQANAPVQAMCRVLNVSPSGFYAWLDRLPSKRSIEDAVLVERIRSIHADSDATYGMPRVRAELIDQGVKISGKRVARLMRSNGIRGVSRRRGFVVTTRRDERQRLWPGWALHSCPTTWCVSASDPRGSSRVLASTSPTSWPIAVYRSNRSPMPPLRVKLVFDNLVRAVRCTPEFGLFCAVDARGGTTRRPLRQPALTALHRSGAQSDAARTGEVFSQSGAIPAAHRCDGVSRLDAQALSGPTATGLQRGRSAVARTRRIGGR